mmetsp:Transcript_24788/g.59795  ORF Transcript_24788/g.59795 Transcript_24788/m.59795 type:complete len:205 (+) Transcript_24788:1046-1660(+)
MTVPIEEGLLFFLKMGIGFIKRSGFSVNRVFMQIEPYFIVIVVITRLLETTPRCCGAFHQKDHGDRIVQQDPVAIHQPGVRLRQPDEGFQKPHGDERPAVLLSPTQGVVIFQQLRRLRCQSRAEPLPYRGDVGTQFLHAPTVPSFVIVAKRRSRTCRLRGTVIPRSPDGVVQQEVRDPFVPVGRSPVEHDEYQIEPRQQRRSQS